MRILGIETSCDETGIAIYDEEQGLIVDRTHSQIATHAPYGGTVPELASRDHIQKLIPLLEEVIAQSKMQPDSFDGIAYTKGPGLMGALLVGCTFAKALGYAWKIPTLGIHHMEAHLLAALLETPAPKFPFLALLVSGGHTMLVKVTAVGNYKILGESIDDAVGEAFDKTAKLLGLPYPGGPEIEKLAKTGKANGYNFPRPLTERKGVLDFSFSGLKTFTRNTYAKSDKSDQTKANIAYAFQTAAIDTLCIKCKWALDQTKLKHLVVAGGVGANTALRQALIETAAAFGAEVFYPRPEFCTDNGAMIAFAGYQRFKNGQQDMDLKIQALPRWNMLDLEGEKKSKKAGKS